MQELWHTPNTDPTLVSHIWKTLDDWKFQRQCVLRGCGSFSTWPWKQDFTIHPPPHPNDISLSGRALQPNTASGHSLLLMCFKSTDLDTCGYWQCWEFSHHCKTFQSCEKSTWEKDFHSCVKSYRICETGNQRHMDPCPQLSKVFFACPTSGLI